MGNLKNGFRLRHALFPAGYYGANSICQGYISLYYTQLGFSGGQLGALSASAAAAALLFQPLWGRLGDGAKNRRGLLALLGLAAALAFPLKMLKHGFAWQLFCAALFHAFFCALLPLGDSLLLSSGERFGAYRLAGGISFALVGWVYGMLRSRLGPFGLWIVGAMLLFTAGSALLLPASSGQGRRAKGGMLTLLKDRQLALLLALTLPLQATMGYYYAFHAPQFKSIGGSDALLGLGYLLCSAGEAPYLLLSGRIYRKWNAAGPMCIAAGLMSLRWLLLGITESPALSLLSQLLHGGGFIVITVSMAQWINAHAPEGLRSSGQALLNMVSFGLARICGSLLGGWAAHALGMQAGFLICAGLCLAAGAGLAAAAHRAN